MKFKRFALAGTAFVVMSFLSNQGVAQNLPLQVTPNQLDRVGGNRQSLTLPSPELKVSERQAIEIARGRFAGNVLRIGLIGKGNSQRYQIRMENEGKVFTVFVNAVSGRVTRGG
ncbi:MAG: PepSY domain-containing protein [Pseudohongiellaceae bacterium]